MMKTDSLEKRGPTFRNATMAFCLTLFFVFIRCSIDKKSIEPETRFLEITPSEAYTLIVERTEDESFIILDVRTSQEYSEGTIGGAIQVDWLSSSFPEEILGMEKTNAYLILCRSGNRSKSAFEWMQDAGFMELYNLLGGITRWIDEGYPVDIP